MEKMKFKTKFLKISINPRKGKKYVCKKNAYKTQNQMVKRTPKILINTINIKD